MYTKTATAVVLALLARVQAETAEESKVGPLLQQPGCVTTDGVEKCDYRKTAKVFTSGCTGYTSVVNLRDGGDSKAAIDAAIAAAEDPAVTAGNDPVWACFNEAAKISAQDDKAYCVNYVTKHTDFYKNEHPAKCNMHVGQGLECDSDTGVMNYQPNYEAVYMTAGKFLKDKRVQEADCGAETIERFCRCEGWSWAVETEKVGRTADVDGDGVMHAVDENGAKVTEDAGNEQAFDENIVYEMTEKKDEATGEVVVDAGGETVMVRAQTVNGEDKFKVVTTCPILYEGDGVTPLADDKQTPKKMETNWMQLPENEDGSPAYLEKCPENWEVPVDTLVPEDKGSFKGYTNRYTFSPVADDKHTQGIEGGTPVVVTWNNESEGYSEWSDAAKIGCIGGFSVFGLGIIFVCIMIAIDMRRRMAMYEELIQEDLQKMQQMGLGGDMAKMNEELAARLAGGTEDAGVDDQLVTQALELKPEAFAKHM